MEQAEDVGLHLVDPHQVLGAVPVPKLPLAKEPSQLPCVVDTWPLMLQ